jgi:hypothetical protein
MFFFILRVDQYVIDLDHHKLDPILHKFLAHQTHIVGRVFHQSKIHHYLLVWVIPQNEGRLRKVTFSYLQFIPSRSKIDLGKHTRTTELIKQIINPRQRCLFSTVTSFRAWQYTHICWVPSILGMKITGAPHGGELGQM